LNSNEEIKRGDEPKTKNLEQNQPPDERRVRESEGEAIQADQNQNQAIIQNNTQLVPYEYPPFRLPQGGWLISPFQELKFSGRETDLNPVAFLERYENIAIREGVGPAEKLSHFPRCLTGSAASWYDTNDFISYEEMKGLFLQRFWNESIQTRVRQQIYMGKYDTGRNKTAAEYVLELSRLSKSLDSPMSDKEFIVCISRHFDAETALMIRPGVMKTLSEMVEYLTHADTLKRYHKAERQTKTNQAKSVTGKAKSEPNATRNNPDWRGSWRNQDKTSNKSYRDKNNGNDSKNRYAKRNNENKSKDKSKAKQPEPESIIDFPNSDDESRSKKPVYEPTKTKS